MFEDTYFITDAAYEAHRRRPETQFVQQDVFGFAEILSLPKFLNVAATAGLSLADVFEHSSHYRRTIDEWILRFRQRPCCELCKIIQVARQRNPSVTG